MTTPTATLARGGLLKTIAVGVVARIEYPPRALMVVEVRSCCCRLAIGAEAARMETTGANHRNRLARRNTKTRPDVARVSGVALQHGNGKRYLEVGAGELQRRPSRRFSSGVVQAALSPGIPQGLPGISFSGGR